MKEVLEPWSEWVPLVMTVVALLVVIFEWVLLAVKKQVKRPKEGWVNIYSAALTYLPIFALSTTLSILIMFGVYQFRLFDLGLDWWVWVLCYVAYDFMSYAIHWLSHKVRLLWCIHSVHHSAKEMKASVAFRGSFAEFFLAPHLTLWLPLLGFHPLMIVIVEGVGQLYGVPLHLNAFFAKSRKTWLKKVFITPSIHRLHHASNDLYVDTNYGLTFALWDKLFKTYQSEVVNEKPVYGLAKEIDSENLVESQTDEFRSMWKDMKRASRFSDKLKYMLMPPGWNHEGGGFTARSIRNRALEGRKSQI